MMKNSDIDIFIYSQ